MHLNEVAEGLEPLDLTGSAELASLLTSARELGIAHAAPSRYVSRNTVVRHQRLHFLEWGDPTAPAVLLLHGANQSSHAWDLVSLHLAERCHVYALDQRGHGDSEWVRDQDYSRDAMVQDALAFIAQQRIERPIIIGHSMGGGVTLSLAIREPDLARALVFVDMAPVRTGEGGRQIREFIRANIEFDHIEDFVENVRKYDPFRSVEHMERTARYNLIRRADGKYVSKSDRFLHERAAREASEANPAGQVTLDQVKVINRPALVVRGESSNVLIPVDAQAFVNALPQGRFVEVPKCGHNVHTQNTPGFLDALRPFLEEVERG
jgi:pimeloyl-ACP methyl ester carboxylesterase